MTYSQSSQYTSYEDVDQEEFEQQAQDEERFQAEQEQEDSN